jgi:hypothetical protein
MGNAKCFCYILNALFIAVVKVLSIYGYHFSMTVIFSQELKKYCYVSGNKV